MTKSEQTTINAEVLDFLEAYPEILDPYAWPDSEWKPLRNCSAKVASIGHLKILRSYSTIIAAIDTQTNTLYDFLRYVYGYTATSAQHISKFAHDYGYSPRILRYYPV